jgi:hypothetical protein
MAAATLPKSCRWVCHADIAALDPAPPTLIPMDFLLHVIPAAKVRRPKCQDDHGEVKLNIFRPSERINTDIVIFL